MRKWENDKIRINKNTNNTDNYRKSQTNVANLENFISVYYELKEELNENKVKNLKNINSGDLIDENPYMN